MRLLRRTGNPFTLNSLFTNGQNGVLYSYEKNPEQLMMQDFAMTAASSPGDPCRLILDYNSLNKQKVAFLNGATNTCFSTPDRAGLDITGDIDIRIKVALSDWTPASAERLVHKTAGGGQESYQFNVDAGGTLSIGWSSDGAAVTTKVSTVANSIADGEASWVRVTLDVDNGASGNDVKFYTSSDGVTWSQLGDTVTTAGTTSIFAGTANLVLGANSSLNGPMTGKIYRAQVYDGIGGTLVADFDPTQYSGTGSTLADGVSGDWTRNGSAFIAGDGYHRIASSDAVRPLRCRYPRGATLRNKLTATATLSTQNVTTEAVEYTLSFKGTGTVTLTGTSTDGPLVGTGASDRVSLTFTPTAGTLTLTVSGSVTEAQLQYGAAFDTYQAIGAGFYDVTESGIASVVGLYHSGSTWTSAFGTKNLTYMHDGTGGDAVMLAIVNKADDGALDYFCGSRIVGTDVGFNVYESDIGALDATLGMVVANGTEVIASISSDGAISRFTPQTISAQYNIADNPDAILKINGSTIVSGDDTGTPSSASATYDIAMCAAANGSVILPGYEFGVILYPGFTATQRDNTTDYFRSLMGI